MQARRAAVVEQRPDPFKRQLRKLRRRGLEQLQIAREQRPQDRACGELRGRAQMPDQAAQLVAARAGGIRATTNCASVSESLPTSAARVAAGRSTNTSRETASAAANAKPLAGKGVLLPRQRKGSKTRTAIPRRQVRLVGLALLPTVGIHKPMQAKSIIITNEAFVRGRDGYKHEDLLTNANITRDIFQCCS
jgi:hypothetical protein